LKDRLAHPAHLDRQEPMDHLDQQDQKENPDQMERPDRMDSQDQLAQQANLDNRARREFVQNIAQLMEVYSSRMAQGDDGENENNLTKTFNLIHQHSHPSSSQNLIIIFCPPLQVQFKYKELNCFVQLSNFTIR
jgi:hypothetical protein